MCACPVATPGFGFTRLLDSLGRAVPSPFGARHVRGTVVNVPDTPPWRGAAETLSYCSAGGELFQVRRLDSKELCSRAALGHAMAPWT